MIAEISSLLLEIQDILDELERSTEIDFKILFLDAADKEVETNYKSTGTISANWTGILDGIKLERELLAL